MNKELQFSLVLPAYNEAGSLGPLLAEIAGTDMGAGLQEIVVVDDCSTDDTAQVADAAAATDARIRVIRHDRNGGKSAAIHTGVMAARTNIVCTIDADGQNPPSEVPKLIAALADGLPGGIGVVAGQRLRRNDNVTKRIASRLANGLRARVLGDATRDTACGFKVFRRDGFLLLPYFDTMHRYLPALYKRDGWGVGHVDVEDRPRTAGRSKYNNLQRGLVGVVDLFAVLWLTRRRKRASPNADAILKDDTDA